MRGKNAIRNNTLLVSLVIVFACFPLCTNNSSANSESLTTDHHLSIANNGQTVSLKMGDTLDITLGGVGPGYGLPGVIGDAIMFIGDSTVGDLPGGPTLKYFFVGTNIGNSSISITDSTKKSTFAITCKIQ
ncbi:MAG TPA: hypothetical protein VLX68_06480 [Chitinivibrionales bacterium]|nr:hypothetical protein [Chitinivibrionales bacterium]